MGHNVQGHRASAYLSCQQANAGETNPSEVQKMLADGLEAADFIKTFVVQAKLNPRGNFEMQVQPEHADATAEEAALRGKRP
eukprot:jgi/Astpho2/3324/Aster-x0573